MRLAFGHFGSAWKNDFFYISLNLPSHGRLFPESGEISTLLIADGNIKNL